MSSRLWNATNMVGVSTSHATYASSLDQRLPALRLPPPRCASHGGNNEFLATAPAVAVLVVVAVGVVAEVGVVGATAKLAAPAPGGPS